MRRTHLMSKWEILLSAFGLICVFEGIMALALPNNIRRFSKMVLELSTAKLRQIGVFGISIGLIVLWLAGWF